ncbi:choice-of-anchor D domain-containing protein [Accumulibacter sp.]|uniref:choice-of-anchor D domain-containing protein n=1 Tax=Accumulibacter sp. TaxID=2053492 RepID=UPI00260A9525|nr:choice-of-anchor D domain-containing protein [Accumulibacter sp.]
MPARRPTLALKPSLLAILLAFPAHQALAANCTWNVTTGNWATPSDWTSCALGNGNPAATPGSNDTANIGASGVVTINTGQSILTLNNTGQITIDAFGLNLVGGGSTTNSGVINVGGASTANIGASAGHNINNTGGTINIADGSVVNQFGSSITGGTIATTSSGALVAFNNSNNFLSNVTLNGTLDLASNTSVERVANGMTLNGTARIGSASILAPQGDQTIGGAGSIVFSDGNASNRLNVEAGNLVLGSGITLRGETGRVGNQNFAGGAATLTNMGVISADVSGGTITMAVNGLVTNQGTMRAQNGGQLTLNAGGGYDNSAGTLLADVGSTVLFNGTAVSGGVLNSNGSGKFVAANNANNFLNGSTLNGVLDMATATGVERISAGGMTLNGTINIGNASIVAPQGNQTIGGSGTIVFADGNANNRLNVEAGNLILDSGITVRGQTGHIGQQAFAGGAATLTNNGAIQADVSGGAITIAVQGLTTNNGTLAALNGGTLNLNSNVQGNVGSQILAGNGSVVAQNGVTISGVVNTSGTGSFRAANNGSNVFSGVDFAGTLDLASATGVERVVGGLTLNSATVNIAQASVLAPQGDQTIAGNGTIVFADGNANNRLNVEAGNLILASGVTVRGESGRIGNQSFAGGAATLTNSGTIQADVGGGAITLAVNGLTTNNGTLAALNGGTLNLNSSVTGNTGSQILAGAGSVVAQNGVTISGDMNLTGAGSFRASNSGSNVLSGVKLSGTLDLASAIGVERITSGLILNGATINIGNSSVLAPQGDQTISGTGTIVFADASGNNRLNVEAGNLTLASGVTVRGGNGIIGQQAFAGGAATLTNQGLISADVAGRSIALGVNGQVINQNVMEARNGAQLTLNAGGGYDNSAGILRADTGSTVFFNSATVSGGTLNSNGNGKFVASNSGNNFLNGVTLNGVLDLATATGVERISAGGMTLNGTINIASGSVLAPQGNQTIAGTGSIVFADGNASNRLNVEAGNLVIDSGVTVRGQTGHIGQQAFAGGAATLTNNGTINADGGGTITVNVTSALTNNGTMRAQNGTLLIQDAVAGTGTLQVDSTGVMTLANAANTQGKLVMGAAGSTLNIGTQNLTINSDYTNVAAGSGNSFDRRAGVSGAGQIVAGANAAQAITGAGVSDGATANATLTINNVRVGATTFNYQIANTGSTGPALRGAIQTSVNGANLSDARLSGVGVSAGNYNTGGPGSNTGDLGVTFTAATAGALAALSGQVLNLRSNFNNIADQKLNIVLAGGAAAYNAAVGSATPSPLVLANQRVGGSLAQFFTVSNAAPAGSFSEDLNASFSASSGQAGISGGNITGLLAGSANSSTMAAHIDTSSAGAKAGTVTLAYETAGKVNGVSNGLSPASVGSQTINVSGDVYRLAQGATTPTPIAFGNRHVGDTASQNLSVQNSAAADGFSEKLNASFGSNTGAASNNGGSINGLVAGGSNASSMSISLDTSSAGSRSGSVTLNYVSDGAGTSGLAAIAAGSQTINVSGDVYRLASANTLTAINFGSVHVGDTVQQALSISNTAIADSFSEKLNASFGASSDARITTSGSVSQLVAGTTDSSSMLVGLNTAAAGNVNGTQVINFASDGTGSSGLGITSLASQTIGVSGDISTSGSVFRLASASPATPNPVNFGNVRIGATAEQALSISNTAADDGFSEKLNASISSNGAPVTASGAFNLLAAQATDSSSLQVGIDTSSAGAKSGSATIALVSDGTGTSGLAPTNLPSQTVNVSGNVYRLADPSVNTGSVNLVARRGDTAPTASISVSNQSPDAFTEGLKAGFGPVAAGFSGSGTIANLAAQGTDASSLQVALNTATAGNFAGNAQLDFVSTGAGTTAAADVSVGNRLVSLAGKVYEQAVAQVNTVLVDFGIVHKGEVVAAKNVSVSNSAPVAAVNDTLKGSFINMPSGPFAGSGSVTGLAAGQTDASSLLVSLDTANAGVFSSGGDKLQFASHNPDMADLPLGNAALTLQAQVNNFANPNFFKTSGIGSLSGGGFDFLLDFGTLTAGSGMVSALLQLANDVSGPADLLDGAYSFALNEFLKSGFDSFADLTAGDSQSGLQISLDTLNAGNFSDTIVLSAVGHNASGFSAAFNDIRLTVQARVQTGGGQVPEPGSLLLLTIALAIIVLQRRRAQC